MTKALSVAIGVLLLASAVTLVPVNDFFYLLATVIVTIPMAISSMSIVTAYKIVDNKERKNRYLLRSLRQSRVFAYGWRIARDFILAMVIVMILHLASIADLITLAIFIPLSICMRYLIRNLSSYRDEYATCRTRRTAERIVSFFSTVLYPFVWYQIYRLLESDWTVGTLADTKDLHLGQIIAIVVDAANSVTMTVLSSSSVWVMFFVFVSGGICLSGLWRYFSTFLLGKEDLSKLFFSIRSVT